MSLKSFIGVSILIHLLGAVALYFYYNPIRIPPQPVQLEADFSNVPPEMRAEQGQWHGQGQRQWQGQGVLDNSPQAPPLTSTGQSSSSAAALSHVQPPLLSPEQSKEEAGGEHLQKEQRVLKQKSPPPIRQKKAKRLKKPPLRKKAQQKKISPPPAPKAIVEAQKAVAAVQPKQIAAVKSPPVSSVRGVEGDSTVGEIKEAETKQGIQVAGIQAGMKQNLGGPREGDLVDSALAGSSVGTASPPASASKSLPLGAASAPALSPPLPPAGQPVVAPPVGLPAVSSAGPSLNASTASPAAVPKPETSLMAAQPQKTGELQAKAQPEAKSAPPLNREDMEEIAPEEIEKEPIEPPKQNQKQVTEDIEREEIEEPETELATTVVAPPIPPNKVEDGSSADPSVKLAAAPPQAIVATPLPLKPSPLIRSFYTLKQKMGNPPLTYPEFARRGGMQGTVSILFSVTEHGLVDVIELESSSGHSELDNFVLRTIARYEFLPGQGPSRVRYKVPFILEGEEVEYLRLRER